MSKQETDVNIYGVDFIVEYYYDKGEPMVMYYPDGSGHPGSPPSVELDGIYIEGSEQELYDVLDESVITRIEEKILESYE